MLKLIAGDGNARRARPGGLHGTPPEHTGSGLLHEGPRLWGVAPAFATGREHKREQG